jgi:nitroreductase
MRAKGEQGKAPARARTFDALLQNMKFSVSELTDVVRERRTIRPEEFSPRVVHREIVHQILANGTWAPTHGMTQPWRFHVFTSSARERLSSFLGEEYRRMHPGEKFQERKYQNAVRRPLQSSVVVALGMVLDASGRIAEEEEVMAMACAVQNMMLTCTAQGLGSFWATGKVNTSNALCTFLGLGPNARCLGLLFIGYPAGSWPKGYRRPLEDVVTWVDQ